MTHSTIADEEEVDHTFNSVYHSYSVHVKFLKGSFLWISVLPKIMSQFNFCASKQPYYYIHVNNNFSWV